MPPLSLTPSKYAFAMTVKSVPGCFVAMAPSLMGAPFAFFPVPRPQTLFAADAVPDPTFPAFAGVSRAPRAHVASSSAVAVQPTRATPTPSFFDLIPLLLWPRSVQDWTLTHILPPQPALGRARLIRAVANGTYVS